MKIGFAVDSYPTPSIPFPLYFAPSSFIYENRLCCGLLPHPLLQKRIFGKENKIEGYSLLCVIMHSILHFSQIVISCFS
jgi:hypothetical protein